MSLQKKGKKLRNAIDYSEAIASALRAELGDTHRAAKTVMKWTGASERAVKNWLSGESGPHGRYLIAILRYSDVAPQTILAASRRLDLLDHLLRKNGNTASGRNVDPGKSANSADRGDHRRTANHDPNREPDHDPIDDPDRFRDLDLNDRQIWFLDVLIGSRGAHRRACARSIEERFDVSRETAKRDIAALKSKGVLQFIGTRRRGRYVPVMAIPSTRRS